jgi:hypothetical protein
MPQTAHYQQATRRKRCDTYLLSYSHKLLCSVVSLVSTDTNSLHRAPLYSAHLGSFTCIHLIWSLHPNGCLL